MCFRERKDVRYVPRLKAATHLLSLEDNVKKDLNRHMSGQWSNVQGQ